MARNLTEIANDLDDAVVTMVETQIAAIQMIAGGSQPIDRNNIKAQVRLSDGRLVELRALVAEVREHATI